MISVVGNVSVEFRNGQVVAEIRLDIGGYGDLRDIAEVLGVDQTTLYEVTESDSYNYLVFRIYRDFKVVMGKDINEVISELTREIQEVFHKKVETLKKMAEYVEELKKLESISLLSEI